MDNFLRIAIVVIGVFMTLVGLGFLFAPATLAAAFYVEALGSQGLASIRADFSGFFIGVGVFALVGAWTRQAQPLLVPLLMLGVALFGRFISLVIDGMGPAALPPMIAEAVMIGVLYIGWRRFESLRR